MENGANSKSSDAKQPEQSLTELRNEIDVLAAIFDNASALIVVLNLKGRIISFNRSCENISGYTAIEMKGKYIWSQLVPAEDIESAKAVVAKLATGRFPLEHENRWVTSDGGLRHIAWTSTVQADDSGEMKYIIGTGIDITDRHAADEELHQRTHDLDERDKELACLYGISRLRERRDLTLEQVFKQVTELIPPAWQYPEITAACVVFDNQTIATSNYKKTRWSQSSNIIADNEHVGTVEVCYLKRKPKLVEGPFLAEERALIDAIAERLGRVVVAKKHEEKLLKYQQKLRQLASELSLSEERERRRLAGRLHDEIGQMLALTRIKLGELRESVPDKLLVDITELVDSTIKETRSLTIELSPPVLHEVGFVGALEWLVHKFSDEHGITAGFHDDKLPKPLSEDIRVVLFQAVGELLHNIVKHAGASHVQVSLTRTNGSVQIEVTDDGIGFDSAGTISRAGKEDKFGLFNIRERISHIDGKTEIKSEIGKGTQLILTAPLELIYSVQKALTDENDAAQGERVRVLLVDDHQIIREGLRVLLEKHTDIEVVAEAASGEDAVRLASEHTPDVVVMDVAMPDMTGIEATKLITEQLPNTHVIALSMHSDGQFVLEMLRAGAAGYLLKDSAQEDLAQAIRMVSSQLTFISHGIAGNVIENYIQHKKSPKSSSKTVLTPREEEVLKLLADGFVTKQIASQLTVSVKTIEAHRQHIMEKLEMNSVADLTKYAIREGLVNLDQ